MERIVYQREVDEDGGIEFDVFTRIFGNLKELQT
jgi:chromosome segregation ATPase